LDEGDDVPVGSVPEDEDGEVVLPVADSDAGAGPPGPSARCVAGGSRGSGVASATSSGWGGAPGGRTVTARVLRVALSPSPTVT
jgi:hypothetical protein